MRSQSGMHPQVYRDDDYYDEFKDASVMEADEVYNDKMLYPSANATDFAKIHIDLLEDPEYHWQDNCAAPLFSMGGFKPGWIGNAAVIFILLSTGWLSLGYYFYSNIGSPFAALINPERGWFHDKVELLYTKVMDLPEQFIPTETDEARKRLIFIGDAHGMLDPLHKLLEKIGYDNSTDHLVFTGDIVTKGPHSLPVIDFARETGASCVRGNQDHKVLEHFFRYRSHHFRNIFCRHDIDSSSDSDSETGDEDHSFSKKKGHKKNNKNNKHKNKKNKNPRKAKKIAKQMNPHQAQWLNNCPLILRVNGVRELGNVVVVHAGLVPGVELQSQDPQTVMNMRSINASSKKQKPSPTSRFTHWADLWNTHEEGKNHTKHRGTEISNSNDGPTTVIYGHYAARGLDIRPFTKGLDSNCVRGGSLSALVVSSFGNHKMDSKKSVEIVSVGCPLKK